MTFARRFGGVTESPEELGIHAIKKVDCFYSSSQDALQNEAEVWHVCCVPSQTVPTEARHYRTRDSRPAQRPLITTNHFGSSSSPSYDKAAKAILQCLDYAAWAEWNTAALG